MPFVCLFEVFGRLSVFTISFGFALESIYYFICPISAEKKAILQTILYMHQLLLSNLIQANRKSLFGNLCHLLFSKYGAAGVRTYGPTFGA